MPIHPPGARVVGNMGIGEASYPPTVVVVVVRAWKISPLIGQSLDFPELNLRLSVPRVYDRIGFCFVLFYFVFVEKNFACL
jgi:hypothetical protein